MYVEEGGVVFVFSMRYCHLNTSLIIVYLNHISNHHFFDIIFLLLSSVLGSDFKITIFFIITVVVNVVTIVLCVAYWHVD